MASKLVHHRKSAFIAQSHRCFYCGFPMWESDCKSFAQAHKISFPQAKWFQCTAEHLEARKDGGKNTAQNIAAACLWCNQKRHKRKIAPSPKEFQLLVKQRLTKGRWHCTFVTTQKCNKNISQQVQSAQHHLSIRPGSVHG